MTPEELVGLWARIDVPAVPERLEGVALPGTTDVWAAIDHLGRRHLLLLVPEGAAVQAVSTHGLEVSAGDHEVAGRPAARYADLVCLDEGAAPTFAAVAADICSHVVDVEPAARADVVQQALARWRWFWDIDPDRLGSADALGLFGELWFLHRWLTVGPETVQGWTGSDGARHDFQWSTLSVEVKTTALRNAGAAVHRIASLDQLAPPEIGPLYLFSLRVTADALSANTLPAIVDEILAQLVDPAARRMFEQRLAQRGYSPVHRHRHERPYRILEERLYHVRDDFPRLTPTSFGAGQPVGIGDISYTLDMAACGDWLVAGTPEDGRPWLQGSA